MLTTASLPSHSLGALLAEEWTIHPCSSPLPSVMEMIWIEEATVAMQEAVQTALGILQQSLRRFLVRQQQHQHRQQQQQQQESVTNVRPDQLFPQLVQFARRTLTKAAHILHTTLSRYSMVWQCWILFLLERRNLQTATCATIAESMFMTKRVREQIRTSNGNDNSGTQGAATFVPLMPLESPPDTTRAALFIALGPYLRERVYDLMQKSRRMEVNENEEVGDLRAVDESSRVVANRVYTLRDRIYRSLILASPLVWTVLHGMSCWYAWRYLLQESVYFDLTNRLLRQVVRRRTQEDQDGNMGNSVQNTGTPNQDKDNSAPQANASASATKLSKGLDLAREKRKQYVLYVLTGSMLLSWLTELRNQWQSYQQEQLARHSQEDLSSNSREAPTAGQVSNVATLGRWNVGANRIPPPPPLP